MTLFVRYKGDSLANGGNYNLLEKDNIYQIKKVEFGTKSVTYELAGIDAKFNSEFFERYKPQVVFAFLKEIPQKNQPLKNLITISSDLTSRTIAETTPVRFLEEIEYNVYKAQTSNATYIIQVTI